MPCSVILEPADLNLKNAKGVAFIYKVQLIPPSVARTNISILAVHFPMDITTVTKGLLLNPVRLVGGLHFIQLLRKTALVGREDLT